MTDTRHGLALDWLELPQHLDQSRLPMPATTADFLQVSQLANLITSLFWGSNDFYESPENRLAAARPRPDFRVDYVAARLDDPEDPGRIVGFGFLAATPAAATAEVWVGVHPGFRRRGVGSALLAGIEAEALRRGHTTLQSWTDNALVDPASAGPPEVRSSAADAAFAAARGYVLAQLEWCSVLALPEAAGPARQVEAAGGPGGDYELVGWEGACPEEHAESMAGLRGRMPAEAPRGELEIVPEAWDVDRLRAEERAREQIHLTMVTTAARHRPSGRLVGHSDIETFRDLPQVAYQGSTLVHPDHRGRHLALLLKAANISRLVRSRPTVERVYAWAARENAAILRANETLGFRPVSTRPGWQRRIGGSGSPGYGRPGSAGPIW
ncbi:GNAT family N-acetyltransferase [Citricoccus sp.]|uniref:GNAT family N-acetyltransferase n=1 Tax=Citricoccus sp. TaxID=1978372 RepID=UPI0026341148|nr:GNAT family N-acetyltransferase [Citricoccus sp.]HRO29996.1 GNAT family N-acetyltransferase [Citricoccus sp.]